MLLSWFALVGLPQSRAYGAEFAMRILTTSRGPDTTIAFEVPRLNDTYYPTTPGEEYGMEVVLSSGSPRVIKDITFDYLADFASNQNIVIRVYQNDGPLVDGYPSPGTFLYELHASNNGEEGITINHSSNSVNFDAANFLPDRFTVTLEFLGLSSTRHAGWIVSDSAPTAGSVKNPNFWRTTDAADTWSLFSLGNPGGITNAPVVAGPLTNLANGHTYYLLAEDSWQNSEARAQVLGGHLVTINDAAEQNWVFSTFGSYGGVNRSLWLGYRRTDPSGPFSWVSGETPGYTNWAVAEPDNVGKTEGYAHMICTGNAFNQVPGTWNDLSSPNAGFSTYNPLHGVVEVQPTTPVVPPVLTVDAKAKQACWTADTGRSYQIQVATDPAGPWTNFGVPVVGGGTQCASLDLSNATARRFFRVVVNP